MGGGCRMQVARSRVEGEGWRLMGVGRMMKGEGWRVRRLVWDLKGSRYRAQGVDVKIYPGCSIKAPFRVLEVSEGQSRVCPE